MVTTEPLCNKFKVRLTTWWYPPHHEIPPLPIHSQITYEPESLNSALLKSIIYQMVVPPLSKFHILYCKCV